MLFEMRVFISGISLCFWFDSFYGKVYFLKFLFGLKNQILP